MTTKNLFCGFCRSRKGKKEKGARNGNGNVGNERVFWKNGTRQVNRKDNN